MELYHEHIIEQYKHPLNQGSFEDQLDVVSSTNTNVGCGDAFRVELKLIQDSIQDVRWEGQGCVISTVSMSLLSEHLKGLSRSAVSQITQANMLELLGLDQISEGRKKCLMLSLNAVQNLLKSAA